MAKWKLVPMYSCQETVRLLSEGMDHRLTLRQRWGLKAHLAACGVCVHYGRQLERLRAWLRARMSRISEFHEPSMVFLSDAAKAKIKKALSAG